MRAGKKRSVGMSIYSKQIVMVDVNINSASDLEFNNIEFKEITDDRVIDNVIENPDLATDMIRDVLSNGGKGSKRISLSIEGKLANTRLIQMPSMSRDEMQESLISEVEDYAILAGEKPSLDFHVVRRYNVGSTERMDVLFVVVPEPLVNIYMSIMRAVNASLYALETTPLSIIRAYSNYVLSSEDSKTSMLVIIEEEQGLIAILQDKVIKFVHDIEIGRKELELTRDVSELLMEIRSSIDYYAKTFPGEADIDDIVVFTNKLENFNLIENLRSNLNIKIGEPVLPTDVLARFGDQARNNTLSVFSAIGSALHDFVSKDNISINLVPGKKEVKISRVRAKLTALALALVSVVLIFVAGTIVLRMMTRSVEDKIIVLKQQALTEIPNQAELSALEESISQLKARIEITDVAMNSIKWANCARLLEEIRALVPSTLWLTNLRWQEDKNVVFSGYALSYDTVFNFRRSLIESPFFDPVKLIQIQTTEFSGQPVERFEIQCGVKTEIMGGGAKGSGTI